MESPGRQATLTGNSDLRHLYLTSLSPSLIVLGGHRNVLSRLPVCSVRLGSRRYVWSRWMLGLSRALRLMRLDV